MSRVIALNRIPRTNLANRNITYRGSSVSAGGPSGVGDIRILTALPVIPRQTWQDALVQPVAPFLVSEYPDLYRVQGPVISGLFYTAGPAAGVTYSAEGVVAWNGAVYGLLGGAVRKKTSVFGAYGANLWLGLTGVSNLFTFMGPDQAASSRMFHCYQNGSPDGFVRTISNDAAPGAAINIGSDGVSGYIGWLAFETSLANTYLLLVQNAGPIFRTTNGGTSWTPITSNLSNGAARQWCGIWRNKNSGALHMIGAALAIATSVDEGVTWALNNAVPGATSNAYSSGMGNSKNFRASIAFDWVGRRGYVITDSAQGGGGQLSFDLDNPTAGYTVMLPVGNFSSNSVFGYTQAGMFYWANYNQTPKTGLWFSQYGAAAVWTRFMPLADIPVTGKPLPTIGLIGGMATEGFGVLMFDNNQGTAVSFPATWITADGFNTFDRVTLVDPGLTGGRRFYIRVL